MVSVLHQGSYFRNGNRLIMKLIKTYTKGNIKMIAKTQKIDLTLYLRSLVNRFVVLKKRQDGGFVPVCYYSSNEPVFFPSAKEAYKKEFNNETDILMSAYTYLNLTCGISF